MEAKLVSLVRRAMESLFVLRILFVSLLLSFLSSLLSIPGILFAISEKGMQSKISGFIRGLWRAYLSYRYTFLLFTLSFIHLLLKL